VDASRKRAVGAGSGCDGMGHEGMPDEGRGDQIDEIAGPAACSADRHYAATRDACRMDAEARRRCGDSPAENERNARHGNRDDEQSPGSPGHGTNTSEARRLGEVWLTAPQLAGADPWPACLHTGNLNVEQVSSPQVKGKRTPWWLLIDANGWHWRF
jgi:hypothetical protein